MSNNEGTAKGKRRSFPTKLLWILATFLILFVGLTLMMLVLGLNHPYFRVDNYRINGNISKSDEEVIEYMDVPPDQSIFSLDIDQVEARLQNMGNIEEVQVKKVVPDTLLVDIVEDKYIGYIQVDNGYLLIGANLKVEEHVEYITDEQKDELIQISNASYDALALGNDVSADEDEMEFLSDLINHVLREITSQVTFDEDGAVLDLSIGTKVDFGPLKETDYKIALIEKIVSDLQSRETNPKEIILDSSSNPIVVAD